MNFTAIEDIFEFVRNGASIKQSESASGIPITRIETIWDSSIDTKRFGYADVNDESYKKYYLEVGDILMSHINSPKHLGKCAIYKGIPEVLIHGMNLLGLRPHKSIAEPKYLHFYLNSSYFKQQVKRISNQSVNQASFSSGNLKKLKIPLPPLSEQKKIAEILDAADSLRQKDQQLIEHYNALSQSLFLDMFGDPTSNPMSWELLSLGELCEFENGDRSSNYPSKSEILESGKLFLSSADIGKGYFKVKSSKFISQEKFDSLKRGKCNRDDILMTLRGNGLGRTCVFECEYDEGFINAQMVILRTNKIKCTSRFLVSQLNNTKVFKDLLRFSSGSAQPQFSAAEVKRFKVLIPPLDSQNKFQNMIKEIEMLKQQAQANLQKSEDLFNSLLQKAFKGELTS